MSEGLLIVERIVLESVSSGPKNIEEISRDTLLNTNILHNVLPFFTMKNIIRYSKGIYFLNKEELKNNYPDFNSEENIREEVKELVTTMINQHFQLETLKKDHDVELKVKKVWLSAKEEEIINTYLQNLEQYLEQIKNKQKRTCIKSRTHQKKIFLWGKANYSTIMNGIVNSV